MSRQSFFERFPAAAAPARPAGSYWMLALIALVAVIPYLQVPGYPFINFDDQLYVIQNYHVRSGLSLHTLGWALKETEPTNWHPLTMLSHALDCTLFGVDPRGHHATNLLLHALNSALLFLLLFAATGARSQALFVAALFAVHPFNVETVAWVASRKGLLSTLFAFLALIAYIGYAHAPSLKRYLPIMGFMLLGLMAKPMVVTLPFLMLLMDYWPLRRLTGRSGRQFLLLVREKLPLFALALASSAVTYVVHVGGRNFHSYSAVARLANALSSYLIYIGKTIWPSGLCIYYPHPGENINWVLAGAGGALLLAVTILALRFAGSRPYLIVGWLWFLGTLVPVIGIVPIDGNSMADRYAYVPLIGLFVMFAWTGWDIAWSKPALTKILNGTAAVLVVVLAACTWHQAGYWQNSRTVFRHALAVTGSNALAEGALGDALLQDGDLQGAVAHLRSVLKIQPASGDTLHSLGVALLRLGRTDEAVQRLQEAVKRTPGNAWFRTSLAVALYRQSQLEAAYRAYQQALEIDPEQPEANCGIGWIELGRNNPQAAIEALRKAVVANPAYGEGEHRLGVALLRQGRWQEGAEHLTRAVQLEPGVESRFNLGLALVNLGRYGEAEALLRQVLAEQPDHLEARSHLGLCLGMQGKLEEAIDQLRLALKANPNHASSLHHLAVALASEGQLEEALILAERAYALDSSRPGLSQTLDQLRKDVAAARQR